MKLQFCLVLSLLGAVDMFSWARADVREGLLLEYAFEGDATDSSGGTNHGAVNGSAVYGEGRVGQGMIFGGSDWVDTGMVLPSSDTFTIECWINPATTQVGWADIFGNHADGGVNGVVLQQEANQTNRFSFVYGSTEGKYIQTSPISLVPGKWQHVACVKDATEARFYLNGVLMDVVEADAPMAASSIPLRVGLGFPGTDRCFQGMIDEFRVWNRALSDFGVTLTVPEQLDQFSVGAGGRDVVSVHWPKGRGVVTEGEAGKVELSMDERFFPAAVSEVRLDLTVVDYGGKVSPPLPALVLTRDAGFTGKIALPSAPGYYTVTYAPTVFAGERRIPLGSGTFTFAALPEHEAKSVAIEARALPSTRLSLDGDVWQIATDAGNIGREQNWPTVPVAGAQAAKVPWIMQGSFPGYHGVAWYWSEFEAPVNAHAGGRYLLRFSQVDYLAEVWLNGAPVGGHEGGETPFELDVTETIRAGAPNLLAVRVLNPTHERIDGIVLDETPHRCKVMPYRAGAAYNHGGITGSVNLAVVPAVRIQDVFVRADAQTGVVRVQARVRNASQEAVRGRMTIGIAPGTVGDTLKSDVVEQNFPPGDTLVESRLMIDGPEIWDLNTPYLYRADVSVAVGDSSDEKSTRFGFREFRFENGYFRLNGRRIFLRSSHTVNHFPIGLQFPHDPDLARRDLLNAKVMGFNMVRFICGGATPEQLDLCDEIGLLVYEESYASWFEMVNTPEMKGRFDRAIGEVIERDRNHPSVVVWGLLNEIQDGPLFRHAVESLPLVRYLDDSRLVMLNSGRWDGQPDIGTLCNPGSTEWEASLGVEAPGAARVGWSNAGGAMGYFEHAGDAHTYMKVPQKAESTAFLRTVGQDTKHVFLSEYGIGSAVDLPRTVRHYERLGMEHLEDAQFYRDKLNRFLADWERWDMGACFDRPEDFFAASLARMASNRIIGLNAIRSNPNLVGHNVTGLIDHVMSGEGLTTPFREMKPGAIDAMYACWAPLRLCLFAEPVSIYRHGTITLEAVLANEDALRPGDYPIRLEVIAPDGTRALARTVTLTIPEPDGVTEAPLALPVFSEEIVMDGVPGKYRFVASFEQGAAATGGETEFYVTDATEMPPVEGTVTLWGEDPELAQWLTAQGIASQPFSAARGGGQEVILIGAAPPAGDRAKAFEELNARISQGATAIFLSPSVFAGNNAPVAWLPASVKGTIGSLNSWLYLMDAWGKEHPIFDGLPTNGLLDYVFYRNLIRDLAFNFESAPEEAVAGGIEAAVNYGSGLLISVHRQDAGRLILNTLLIRENLGSDPTAERILRNMLRYAAKG